MGLFSDLPGDEGLPGAQRRLVMVAVMTVTAMAVLDGTIVNVALPQIGRALRVPAADTVWVANGYLLSAAMTLAIFSSLASRIGYRRMFCSGLALFTLASLGCALSASLTMLTAMRLLQGIGGAAVLSIAPAILRTAFPNRLLGRLLGVNALMVATCSAVGPTLGGVLLSVLSWPWLFAINVPVGIVALAMALRAVPRLRQPSTAPFDSAGALLSAVAMGALIMAAGACARLGEADSGPLAFAYGVTAIVAGVAFVWRQRRAAQPLIPLDMFASSRFSLAALTSLVSFVGQGIAFVALPFLFQSGDGYSALHSALLFTPWPIGIILTAPYAGRLADRKPPAVLASIGLAVLALGLVLLALLPDHAAAWDICWRGLVCGAGFGFFQSPNNREMLANAARERSASASGVLAIVRTFGQCLGAAIVGLVLSLVGGGAQLDAAQDAQAIRLSLWVAAAATLLATAISVSRIRASLSQAPAA